MDIPLLRKDECEPLTTEQMTDIKSQFHPSNTVNVNITPYHIYDEDGVEQRVGEVRKTIDGVKKSKPVWEKTVTGFLSPQTADAWANLGVTISNVSQIISGVLLRTSDSASTTSVAFKMNGNNVQYIADSKTILPNCNVLILRYTKTTDTWQPV